MKLNREKKLLLITILMIAAVQMPQQALTPAIETIVKTTSWNRSLAEVQDAFALVNIFIPAAGLLTAFFIGRGIITKRGAIIGGLFGLGATAACALVLHNEFWQLRLLSVILGISIGSFIVNTTSVMFDSFNAGEREKIAGFQTAFVSSGGFLLSLVGGALAARVWYGGYFVLLLGIPIAVFAYFAVPKRPAPKKAAGTKASKLPGDVYYYSAVLFVFFMLFTTSGMNISTHLAQANADNPALAGAAVAVQMGGGAIAGLVFGKLSPKLGDYIMVLGCGLLALGFALLGAAPQSVPVAFVSVFIVGTSMSLLAPRTVFAVSGYTDESNSSLASGISQSVAPSLGGFLTPVIITRVTEKLFGDSTASRFLFTSVLAVVFAAVVALITRRRSRKIAETV
ncbi:MAG: MFS transporter [Oscillospiraceae bacterium]|jgi:MFS family permease|nr:MFS transporter [Oscillospiraceae bacterium]